MEREEVLFCSFCSASPATEVCCCSYPPPPFCNECLPYHLQQTEAIHFLLPLSCIGRIEGEESLMQAREHFIRIRTAEEWLNANLEEIHQCEEAIRTATSEAIRLLTAATTEHLTALSLLESSLKSLISSTSTEVASHLLDPSYFPSSSIARTLWSFSNSCDPASLDVFKWKVSVQHQDLDVQVHVSFWTTYAELDSLARKRKFDPEDPRPPVTVIGMSQSLEAGYTATCGNETQVAFVNDLSLHFFDCAANRWRPTIALSRPISADETSSYCILENNSVLCTGGGNGGLPWDCVYQLSQSGAVRELSRMMKPRRRHAIVKFGEFAFVFGGWSETRELSSEKLRVSPANALDNKEWTRVSDMLFERSSFNPCCHNQLIYLCGGAGCLTGELFDPIEELHSPLPFTLPDQSETFSVVKDGFLMVVSKENVSVWSVAKQLWSNPSAHVNVWGSMTPIHIEKFVYLPYILPDKAFVEQFDLDTMEVTKSYMPE